jgi:hypothetical protein
MPKFVRLLLFASTAAAQMVVVHPKLIHDVLVNPGMGIQTFQRFNGDALNPALKWSEEGPTGPLDAVGKPEFPTSTIAYCRWFWATLEPEHGYVRWDIVGNALVEAHRHGQTLAIRLMPYDQKHPLPVWYRKSGAKRVNAEDAPIWEPDFSDPLYLKYWGDLVKEAGRL